MNQLQAWVSKLAGGSVLLVVDPNGLVLHIYSLSVNPAINTSPTIFVHIQSPLILSTGLLPTYSVRTVMYRLPLEDVESFSTKCPTEKAIQPHEYVKITPADDSGEIDPMESLKLTKRLVLCTSCGTLRLIN